MTDLGGGPVGHNVVVVEEELDAGVGLVSLTEQLQVVAGIVQPVLVPLPVKVLVVYVPVLHPRKPTLSRICTSQHKPTRAWGNKKRSVTSTV